MQLQQLMAIQLITYRYRVKHIYKDDTRVDSLCKKSELFREIERKRYTLYTMLIGFYHLYHLWAGQVVFEIFVPYLFTTGDHMLGAVGCTSDS